MRDLVRLERISDVAVSPDGKHAVFTQRSTDMEANKGRTSLWLIETQKRGAVPFRLTDSANNTSAAEWSRDGRFIYFLSNSGGSNQVWRVGAHADDAAQVTHLAARCGHVPCLTEGRPSCW